MSLEIKGQSCPICKAYLFEEDDIAVCPVCGAPHHRECFINAGHCGMEELHGTDKQYDKAKAALKQAEEVQKEERTQNKPIADNPYGHQGGAEHSHNPFVINFDYLGGVKPDEDLGEGHKADDVKYFVSVSTNRFIPKFKEFKGGAKVWFSIWHLLFPSASFAMRKMYFFAALAGAIEVAAALLMFPLNMSIGELINSSEISNYYQLAQYMTANMDSAILGNLILGAAGIALQAFVRVMSGLFANKLYYRHVIKSMTEINALGCDTQEKILHYRKRGGINLFSFMLAYMIVSWLPTIIFSLIQ